MYQGPREKRDYASPLVWVIRMIFRVLSSPRIRSQGQVLYEDRSAGSSGSWRFGPVDNHNVLRTLVLNLGHHRALKVPRMVWPMVVDTVDALKWQ